MSRRIVAKIKNMRGVYEVFEVLPDGSTVKRAVVSGMEFAKAALERLAGRTTNECFAADANTRQIVAQRNVSMTNK